MDLDLQRSAQGASACTFSFFYRYIPVLVEDYVNFFAVGKRCSADLTLKYLDASSPNVLLPADFNT